MIQRKWSTESFHLHQYRYFRHELNMESLQNKNQTPFPSLPWIKREYIFQYMRNTLYIYLLLLLLFKQISDIYIYFMIIYGSECCYRCINIGLHKMFHNNI